MPEPALAKPYRDSRARIAALCAPMDYNSFLSLLVLNGYSEVGYLLANPELSGFAKTPDDVLAHFCECGIPATRHFRILLGQPDLLDRLQSLWDAPIADASYRLALVATFAYAWWNEALFHDPKITGGTPREFCDQFTDDDIRIMMECRKFGARPYFIFGDSQARLYQHMTLVPGEAWLLPISFTCSGGTARGLKSPDSLFCPDSIKKFGPRINAFFTRIKPYVEEGVKCFFKFSQIDIEYVYFHRWMEEETIGFDETKFWAFMGETLERYMSFLIDVVPQELRRNARVCSIMPSAFLDSTWSEGVLQGLLAGFIAPEEADDLRARIKIMEIPDAYARTTLHKEYNRKLRQAAEAEGFSFVDDASLFLNKAGTRVDDVFLHEGGGKDVHIDRNETSLGLITPVITRYTS